MLELDRIDLSDPANGAENVNWVALRQLFARHGLNVIGVRDGSEELRQSAAAAVRSAESCWSFVARISASWPAISRNSSHARPWGRSHSSLSSVNPRISSMVIKAC